MLKLFSVIIFVLHILGAFVIYELFRNSPGDTVSNIGYIPKQPVDGWSHKVHAGISKIDCRYCHSSGDDYTHAVIPSKETCKGCHNWIAPGDNKNLIALKKTLESDKPIKWVKVYNLPALSKFARKHHALGNVDCAECHGPVEQMDTTYQYSSLRMGSFCINCHKLDNKKHPKSIYDRNASIQCMACHH